MPSTAPHPTINTNRIVGLEIELDLTSKTSGSALPNRVPGWSKKTDGSLYNGFEYVLEPALNLTDVQAAIRGFEAATQAIGCLTTKGGYHVHVSSPDYNEQDRVSCVNLATVYHHFQPAIDMLVGESRHNSTWCPRITPQHIMAIRSGRAFGLDRRANTRSEAKGSRSYSVVNFAMCRVTNKNHRSVEFRQGSASRKFSAIYGWAVLMVFLTEAAASPTFQMPTQPSTFAGFIEWIRSLEQALQASGVADWVEWRKAALHDHTKHTRKFKRFLVSRKTRRFGILSVSKAMSCNYSIAKSLIKWGESKHLVISIGNNGWVSDLAVQDSLAELEQVTQEAVVNRLAKLRTSSEIVEDPVCSSTP